MGKLKTKKSITKRFKVSRRGKVRYKRSGKGHLQSGKRPGRRRHLRQWSRPDNPLIERKLASLVHS